MFVFKGSISLLHSVPLRESPNTCCSSGISLHWHTSVQNASLKKFCKWKQSELSLMHKDQCENGQDAIAGRYAIINIMSYLL